jgi:hypothetical protein
VALQAHKAHEAQVAEEAHEGEYNSMQKSKQPWKLLL